MANYSEDHLADFSNEIELLRASRPTLTGEELDRVYRRSRGGTEQPRTRRFYGSRLAIVATLATGGLLTGGGGALALSGVVLSGNAATAQYAPSPPGSTIGPGHATTPPKGRGHGGTHGIGPAQGAGPGEVPGAEEIEQLTTPSAELPFTGYALFPLMAIGVALIGVGLIGHRRTRRNES